MKLGHDPIIIKTKPIINSKMPVDSSDLALSGLSNGAKALNFLLIAYPVSPDQNTLLVE